MNDMIPLDVFKYCAIYAFFMRGAIYYLLSAQQTMYEHSFAFHAAKCGEN